MNAMNIIWPGSPWPLKFSGENNGEDGDTATIIAPPVIEISDDQKPQIPPMYAVILHNDPITPYQVVVEILREIFKLSKDQAMKVMLEANNSDKAVVAIMAKDMAETKVELAVKLAASGGWPLTFTAELETKGS